MEFQLELVLWHFPVAAYLKGELSKLLFVMVTQIWEYTNSTHSQGNPKKNVYVCSSSISS